MRSDYPRFVHLFAKPLEVDLRRLCYEVMPNARFPQESAYLGPAEGTTVLQQSRFLESHRDIAYNAVGGWRKTHVQQNVIALLYLPHEVFLENHLGIALMLADHGYDKN
jgi:hypothetical protein